MRLELHIAAVLAVLAGLGVIFSAAFYVPYSFLLGFGVGLDSRSSNSVVLGDVQLVKADPSSPTASPSSHPTSSPTTLAPTTPRPTTTTSPATYPTSPSTFYPPWDIPSSNTSVKSTFGDFEWVFPSKHNGNLTEFMQHRYVANEFSACDKPEGGLCCAVGAATAKGKTFPWCDTSIMTLRAEFKTIPSRSLYSMVDLMMAWHKATPTTKRFKLLVLGDSMGGQTYMAALCELARNSKVKSLTYDSIRPPEQPGKLWVPYQEFHVRLHGVEDVDFVVLMVYQYLFTTTPMALRTFLADSDAVLFFFGMHYENLSNTQMGVVLDAIFHQVRNMFSSSRQPPTLMWFGAPKQQYRGDVKNTQVSGLYQSAGRRAFCGPVARYPHAHASFQSTINVRSMQHMRSKLNVSASWFRWDNAYHEQFNKSQQHLHVHFFPYAEITSPFYTHKRGYNPDTTVHQTDCSHYCWAPNFYEPFWDALYLAANSSGRLLSAPNNTLVERFPAGTQQFPNVTKWNSTELEFVRMAHVLANLTQ